MVHIEKAYADIEGAYTMINQQFVEHEIAGKYKYTNREDDVDVYKRQSLKNTKDVEPASCWLS